MSDPTAERKTKETDPEQLARLLELELMQKRAAWKQASTRHNSVRKLSFVFIFLLVLACLYAFFFLFSRVSETRESSPSGPDVSGP